MELQLAQCVLRPWRKEDAESLVRHANNYNVWRNLRDGFPYPYTLKDAVFWLEYTRTNTSEPSYAIVVDGEPVGGIGLILGDDIEKRSAEIGYWLGQQYWGRGIATEAVRALSEYAFAHFDLCRIWAMVFDRNPSSMRVLEKAGFVREAVLRKAITKEGVTIDGILYAVVRGE